MTVDAGTVQLYFARSRYRWADLADTDRPDFVAADIALVLLANASIVATTLDNAPRAWRRFAAYMIDAFRTHPSRHYLHHLGRARHR